MDTHDLGQYLQHFRERFEPRLREALTDLGHDYTPDLVEAMRYTPLAGGKRVRPAVIDLWARCTSSAQSEHVLRAGCAVELIHSCSLVLDDLPSMDDAQQRRGRPACHVAFDVDTAILAANAQLMLAFELLGDLDAWNQQLHSTVVLARAVGVRGMVGGQHVDLHLPNEERDLHALEYVHRHKTGTLFEAAAQIGVRLGSGDENLEEKARVYARNLGLAFQIKDDLLDVTATADELGKDVGKDAGRQNFVSVFGVEESEEIMHRLLDTARQSARDVAQSPLLTDLCSYVATRGS